MDPLIAERAPWLYHPGRVRAPLRALLERLLRYPETVALAERYRDMPPEAILRDIGERLCQRVSASGLHHIPAHGPALVVCTHPTGIADGIVLHHVLSQRRPDLYFFANTDILRVLPQLADRIAPVEWRPEKRSHSAMRETLLFTKRATAQGRLGVIFPSGRLAKRRGLRLHERPWMASAAILARRFEIPVIPIHIAARNSALFYLLDLLHPTLRDITLFHETLNKDQQAFRVTAGAAIRPADLPQAPDTAIALLRDATLRLGQIPAQPAPQTALTTALPEK